MIAEIDHKIRRHLAQIPDHRFPRKQIWVNIREHINSHSQSRLNDKMFTCPRRGLLNGICELTSQRHTG
jgi:hypothetical protein